MSHSSQLAKRGLEPRQLGCTWCLVSLQKDLLLLLVVVVNQWPYLGGGICFEFSDQERLPAAILFSATILQMGH